VLVGFELELLQAEVVGVGLRPAASNRWLPSSWVPSARWTPMLPAVPSTATQAVLTTTSMPSAAKPVGDGRGDVGVLAGQQPPGALHDGDAGPEVAEHLGELTADIAAADDDQVVRKGAQVQQRARRQVGDGVEAVDRQNDGTQPGGQEDPVRLEVGAVDAEPVGPVNWPCAGTRSTVPARQTVR
jgi:hypothetical protein